MQLAADDAPLIESRAVMVPLIGQVGGPTCMEEMDSTVLLAFLEGMLRESEDGAKQVDELYRKADAPNEPEAPLSRDEQIAQFLAFAD